MQTECHPSYAGKNLSSAYMCWAYTWRIRKINNLRYLFGLLDFDRCEGKPGKFLQTFSHFAASNYLPFIILVLRPPDGVFIHILPNAEIIRLTPDDMVVVASLPRFPHKSTAFFAKLQIIMGDLRFISANNFPETIRRIIILCLRRGDPCGRPPFGDKDQ